jgi:hypothetical protein
MKVKYSIGRQIFYLFPRRDLAQKGAKQAIFRIPPIHLFTHNGRYYRVMPIAFWEEIIRPGLDLLWGQVCDFPTRSSHDNTEAYWVDFTTPYFVCIEIEMLKKGVTL